MGPVTRRAAYHSAGARPSELPSPLQRRANLVISIQGAYAARDLSERIRDACRRAWLGWLAGGATAHGIGTWSMHYTGMLAFSLPLPILYDWPMVLLSLCKTKPGLGA
jgi:NO-binding membrane sensor protein with MHYT domain